MVDHKISGEIDLGARVTERTPASEPPKAHLTEKGAELLKVIPATITMDPAGIDFFHTMLQLVFAHKYSPYRVPAEATQAQITENRKAALAFVTSGRAHDANGIPRVSISAETDHEFVTQYTLAHMSRTMPIIIQIDPRQPIEHCLALRTPSGVYVGINFRTLHVPSPPPAT